MQVLGTEISARPRRQLVARVEDGSGALVLRFLNFYPSLQKQLAPGAWLRIFGEVREGFFGAEMIHPRLRVVSEDEPLPDSLTPIYPSTAGLAQSALRKLIDRELRSSRVVDPLPPALIERLGLMDFDAALRTLHHPPPDADPAALEERTHPAWQRIKFDEVLAQQISLRRAYAARRRRNAPRLEASGTSPGRCSRACPSRLPPPSAAPGARSPRTWPARIRCSGCCRAMSAAARPSSPRWPCCMPPRPVTRLR